MKYELVLLGRASDEIEEAYNWYENQATGLGEKFLELLTEYKSSISQHPLQNKVTYKKFREAYLRKFPFLIVYFVDETNKTIVIFSVFHCSRNPEVKYKKNR